MTDPPTMPPILVAGLFRDISQHLLDLLRSLDPDQWHLPTSSSQRKVKDIACHLLDGSLRRVSMQRDGYFSDDASSRIRDDESLLEFLNRLNGDWERATRRLSPTVVVGLVEWADGQLADLFESLDPFAPALFPVAWAGEQQSQNWMDVARDYTEKWHHTQQIFEATGRPSTITGRRLFHPCLDTFMRALPFTFRSVEAEVGAVVVVTVTGEAGGRWHIQRGESGWQQVTQPSGSVQSTVTLDQHSAWKLVTKRRKRMVTLTQFPDIRIDGDVRLGSYVLDMVSMMA